ncbi:MAG: FHA domain-containing protein, partial [Planctomycetota bacterium]
MTRLCITDGYASGFVLELQAANSPIRIGRDSSCAVQIGDPKASRIHAELRHETNEWHLHDLNSSNGTWIDELRIDHLPLTDGTTFRIGRTHFLINDGSDDNDSDAVFDATILDTAVEQIRGLPGGRIPFSDHDSGYLALLSNVVHRANQATSRSALFDVVDDAAADALDGDRCAVFLPTDDGWSPWPAHQRRLRARFGTRPFAGSLLRAVRNQPEPLLCAPRRGDLPISASMAGAGISNAMAAPLRIGDELHGLLYVDRLDSTVPFERTDLELLAAIANHLAVQLHNHERLAALDAEVERLRQPKCKDEIETITVIGDDPAFATIQATLAKAAASMAPVVFSGESGSGRRHLARAIHAMSERAHEPLQVVSCSGDPSALAATLLGDGRKPGVLELA